MNQSVVVVSHSVGDTAAVAGVIARELRPRDVVLLTGDLGAGKTTFTKALCLALGVHDQVTSPTFNLVHEYRGTHVRVCHVDLYRLERTGELADLGLDDIRKQGAVLVVEWGDLAGGEFDDALVIDFVHVGDDSREIRLSARGANWVQRLGTMGHRLSGVGQ